MILQSKGGISGDSIPSDSDASPPGETMNDLLSPDALWITTFFFATAATLVIAVRYLERRW
ncbi:hypothetical protein SMZ79_000551 [Cronobacter turicensis]|nr:hypothetical protein [Cronobacter turicensis]